MSDIKLRISYLFFGGIGLALFLSMLTADFLDPTIFNLLYPSEGVQNWTGLVGALIGGSLLEIFGPSALLLPWLFVRATLHQPRRISGLVCTYYTFVIVFLLSMILAFNLETPTFENIKVEWFEIIYTGVLSAGVGYTLQIIAQSKASPAPAAIILSMESVFGALAAWIIINQVLDANKILGCLAIFIGVIIVQLVQTNKKLHE